ncbi:hypothetical protein PTSG_11386, partial [Salpingoeca rosetta]
MFLRLPPLLSSPSAAHGAARRAWLETDILEEEELVRALQPTSVLYRPTSNLASGVLLQRELFCGWMLPGTPDCPAFVHDEVLAFAERTVSHTQCSDKLTVVPGSLLARVTVDLYATGTDVYVRSFRAQTTAAVSCSAVTSGPSALAVSLTVTSPNMLDSLWPHDFFSNIHLATLPLQLVQALKTHISGTVRGTLGLGTDVSSTPPSVTTFLDGDVFETFEMRGTPLSDVLFTSVSEAVTFLQPVVDKLHQELQTHIPAIDAAVAEVLPPPHLSALVTAFMKDALHPTALNFWLWFKHQRPEGSVLVEILTSGRSKRATSVSGAPAEVALGVRLGHAGVGVPGTAAALQPILAAVNSVIQALPSSAAGCLRIDTWSPKPLQVSDIEGASLDYMVRARTLFPVAPISNSTTVDSEVAVAGACSLSGMLGLKDAIIGGVGMLATYDLASQTVALHFNTTHDLADAQLLSVPPSTPDSLQKQRCLSAFQPFFWPRPSAADAVNDALKQAVASIDTFPLTLTRWPIVPITGDVVARLRAALNTYDDDPPEIFLPALENAIAGASHPSQGHFVSASATAAQEDPGACDIWVQLSTTHNISVTNHQSPWKWLLDANRLSAELTLVGSFHIRLQDGSASLVSFHLGGTSKRHNFVLPSLLSMQSGIPLSSSFVADVNLPDSIRTELKLKVHTTWGATPEFVIGATHTSSEKSSGTTTFHIRDNPVEQAVSPSNVLTVLKNGLLNMIPRALSGSLKFKVYPYQHTLDEVGDLEHIIKDAASLLTIPSDPNPSLATSPSCLAVMEKEPPVTLNVVLFDSHNKPTPCKLSPLDYTSWKTFESSFNAALQQCGLSHWLKFDVLQDTIGATHTGGKPCATWELRPAVPGALTFVSVNSTPARQNLTVQTTQNAAKIPLFGLYEDFVAIVHGIFMQQLPRPKLNTLTIPAKDAGIPEEFAAVYPAELTAVGFKFFTAYNKSVTTTTPIDDSISAAHGLLKAFVRNGSASAAIEASISAALAFAFDCPPPKQGLNVTVWSSLNSSQTIDKVTVPATPKNTLQVIVGGQLRSPPSPVVSSSAQNSSIVVKRVQQTFLVITVLTPAPMISEVDLHAEAHFEAGAQEVEADVSIIDVKARDIKGSTDVTIDIALLPPPTSAHSDAFSHEAQQAGAPCSSATLSHELARSDVLHQPAARSPCPHQPGQLHYSDLSTINHALRQPDSFYSFFVATVDLNTHFQLENISIGVDHLAVVTTGAGIDLTMKDNFTLHAGFNVHDMVNQFKFHLAFHGKESFVRAMNQALSINSSSLCWFAEQLLEPSKSVHRSQVGVHPLPFASKAIKDWLGPYTDAAEKAVEAVCNGGARADIAVLCEVLQESFGHPVCTHSALHEDKLVLRIQVDLVNSSARDSFKYDSVLFEPVKDKPELSIGESASGTLVSAASVVGTATLVIDLSGTVPIPSVRSANLTMAVSVNGQGTIKVWFGPMPVPFSDVQLKIGDPVTLSIEFGEDAGSDASFSLPSQPSPTSSASETALSSTTSGTPVGAGITLHGKASLTAKVNIPFTHPCHLDVEIPKIAAFLLDPSSDTFHFSTPGCPDGLLSSLLRALPQFGFQHALQDFGRLVAQWEREWEEFLRSKLGLGGLLDGLHIPLLDGKWWTHHLHVHLGDIFGPGFFKRLLAFLQPKLQSLNLSGIGAKIKDIEEKVLHWFTEAIHLLLHPWLIHWPKVPDVADKTYKWNLDLHGTLKQKPDKLAFDLGSHGIANLDFNCEEEAQFYWHVNVTVTWSPQKGIRFLFNGNPALELKLELDVPKCDLIGSFLIAGIDIGANALAKAEIVVTPPKFSKTHAWDFELDADGKLEGDAILGFAGIFDQLLHKDTQDTIQALPNFHSHLNCSFQCSIKGCSNAPRCHFGRPRLCVGQLLTYLLHNTLSFTRAQYFQNVERVVDFLEQKVDLSPVLPPQALIDLLHQVADAFCHGKCDFDGVFETVEKVAAVLKLIERLQALAEHLADPTCSKTTHEMQEFILDFSKPDLAPEPHGPSYPPNQLNTNGLAAEHAKSVQEIWNSITVEGSFNVKLLFLEHPLEDLLKMLLGLNVPLVEVTFPELIIDIGTSWMVGPVWFVPSVYVELDIGAVVVLQVPPMVMTNKFVITIFQTRKIGPAMRSLSLRVTDQKTHAALPVLRASVTVGGHVGIGVSIGVVGFYGDLYVGLTVSGTLSIPNVHGTGLVSIGDVLHLVRLNGNVFDATVRTYRLVITLGFGIRGCVSLWLKSWCFTVVSIQTHFVPWQETSNPRIFTSPGSGSGLINLNAAQPEVSSSDTSLSCSGECERVPTFTLTQANNEVDVSVKTTTDGTRDPPRSISMPAQGDCLRFSGSTGGSEFVVRVIGVFRCVRLPGAANMAVIVSMDAYSPGSPASHAATTLHTPQTGLTGDRTLTVRSLKRNSTAGSRPSVHLTPTALVAGGAAGLYFGGDGVPPCRSLNLTRALSTAHVELTGTPCPTHVSVSPSQDVRLTGTPGDFDLVLVGKAGNLTVDMNVTQLVLRNRSVELDGTAIAFTQPPFYLTTRAHPTGNAMTTVAVVAPSAVVTCIGGQGNNTFVVPDPAQIEGALQIQGALTDSSNLLRVHNEIQSGSGSLTLTPTSLSLNNSLGFHHFGVTNMDFFDIRVLTARGASVQTTVLGPDRFTVVNLHSVTETGATAVHRLTGCVDGTVGIKITLDGSGNQQVLVGSGSLENFNCFATIAGSTRKDRNYTIIVDAGQDNRDLRWWFGNGDLHVRSTQADSTQLHLSLEYIDHVYVTFGNASNTVQVTGADTYADFVFQFKDEATAGTLAEFGSTPNAVLLKAVDRGIVLAGSYDLLLADPAATDYNPMQEIQGNVLSLGPGSNLTTRVELKAGKNVPHAQEIVLHGTCISSAEAGSSSPQKVQRSPSSWLRMHAAARGWDPSTNVSRCQVLQHGNATLTASLSQLSDAVYMRGFTIPTTLDLLDGDDVFELTDGGQSRFDVSAGAGLDAFKLQYPMLGSSLNYGDDQDPDTLVFNTNGGVMGTISVDRIGPVNKRGDPVFLEIINNRPEDINRVTCDVRSFSPSSQLSETQGRRYSPHRSQSTPFPGGNAVTHVSYPSEGRTLQLKPDTNVTYVVDALGSDTVLQFDGRVSSVADAPLTASERRRETEQQGPALRVNWQVICSLESYKTTGLIQVLGTADSNATVGMVAPKHGSAHLGLRGEGQTVARLTYDTIVMRVHDTQHVLFIANSSAVVDLQAAPFVTDIVVVAAAHAQVLTVGAHAPTKPLMLVNASMDLDEDTLLQAGSVVAGGKSSTLAASLRSFSRASLHRGCLSLWKNKTHTPETPVKLSPWMLGWVGSALPASHATILNERRCSMYFSQIRNATLDRVSHLDLEDARGHVSVLRAVSVATFNVSDGTAFSQLGLLPDALNVDIDEDGGYMVAFDEGRGDTSHEGTQLRQVTLWQPKFSHPHASIKATGATCTSDSQTYWETEYAADAPGRSAALNFTGRGVTANLELHEVAGQTFMIDLEGVASSALCEQGVGDATLVLDGSQQVAVSKPLPDADTLPVNVTSRAVMIGGHGSSHTTRYAINLGNTHTAFNFSLHLQAGKAEVQFQSGWASAWPIPFGLEVGTAASADVYMPKAMGVRFPTRSVAVSYKRHTYEAEGPVVAAGEGFLLVPDADCSATAFDQIEINRKDRCKQSVHRSAAGRQSAVAVRLQTTLPCVCEPHEQLDEARIGVGTAAASHSGVKDVVTLHVLYAILYGVYCLMLGVLWMWSALDVTRNANAVSATRLWLRSIAGAMFYAPVALTGLMSPILGSGNSTIARKLLLIASEVVTSLSGIGDSCNGNERSDRAPQISRAAVLVAWAILAVTGTAIARHHRHAMNPKLRLVWQAVLE